VLVAPAYADTSPDSVLPDDLDRIRQLDQSILIHYRTPSVASR
jgi:hypothetical protein